MSLVPKGGNDEVFTPIELARFCIDRCYIKPTDKVLEPCCGDGVFLNILNARGFSTDWCEINKGRDFFQYTDKVDWIITNPPFSKYREFMLHSMKLANKIGMLVPFTNVVTKARLRDLEENGFWFNEVHLVSTPKSFPQSGFQLVFVIFERTEYKMTEFWRCEI